MVRRSKYPARACAALQQLRQINFRRGIGGA